MIPLKWFLLILPDMNERLRNTILTRMIQLCHPGPVVEVTEDVRVLLGARLLAGDQEASAACDIFLQVPAIRAVKCVLRQN